MLQLCDSVVNTFVRRRCTSTSRSNRRLCCEYSTVQPHHVKRVSNGFNSDWKPSGYRDVKVNTVVSGHLCEIQLHLRSFYKLKDGQHEVYEWARELKVSTEMDADHLFKMWSPGISEKMVCLAQRNWRRTRFYLPDILADAAQYVQAEEGYKEVFYV